MSNQFGFLSDDACREMDTANQFLAAIATGQGAVAETYILE